MQLLSHVNSVTGLSIWLSFGKVALHADFAKKTGVILQASLPKVQVSVHGMLDIRLPNKTEKEHLQTKKVGLHTFYEVFGEAGKSNCDSNIFKLYRYTLGSNGSYLFQVQTETCESWILPSQLKLTSGLQLSFCLLGLG